MLDQKLAEALVSQQQWTSQLQMSTRDSNRQFSRIRGLLLRIVLEAVTSGQVVRASGGRWAVKWRERCQQRSALDKDDKAAARALKQIEDRYCGPRADLRHTPVPEFAEGVTTCLFTLIVAALWCLVSLSLCQSLLFTVLTPLLVTLSFMCLERIPDYVCYCNQTTMRSSKSRHGSCIHGLGSQKWRYVSTVHIAAVLHALLRCHNVSFFTVLSSPVCSCW